MRKFAELAEFLGAAIVAAFLLVSLIGALDPVFGATLKAPTPTAPSPYVLDASTVAMVDCDKGMGTAVYLGDGKFVTAAHVVWDDTHCKIGGLSVRVDHVNVVADWALLYSDARLPYRAVISCERLKEGQNYLSTGFAQGRPWPVTTRLVGVNFHRWGEAFSRGSIVNGMSGGPVSDLDGVVHAINDSRGDEGVPSGGVVELADTPLCSKATS